MCHWTVDCQLLPGSRDSLERGQQPSKSFTSCSDQRCRCAAGSGTPNIFSPIGCFVNHTPRTADEQSMLDAGECTRVVRCGHLSRACFFSDFLAYAPKGWVGIRCCGRVWSLCWHLYAIALDQGASLVPRRTNPESH